MCYVVCPLVRLIELNYSSVFGLSTGLHTLYLSTLFDFFIMSDMEKTFSDATMQDKSEVQAPNTLTQAPSLDIEGKVDDLDKRRLRAQGHEAQLERSFTWLGASALAYRSVIPIVAPQLQLTPCFI
jgi:hypothetical protein